MSLLPESTSPADLLERLASAEARPRSDLAGRSNLSGGSGGQLGRFAEIGESFLKASLGRRYQSLVQALREETGPEQLRRRLGIYPPKRLWFLSRGSDGAFWACSLSPRLETLRERFNREHEEEGVKAAWDLYLEAFGMTLQAARSGVLLDWNPNNFGLGDARLFYIDDDVMELGQGSAPFVSQALLRLREYAACPLERRIRFLESFARRLAQVDGRDLVDWGLYSDLESRSFWPEEPELVEILERLRRRLDRNARRRS